MCSMLVNPRFIQPGILGLQGAPGVFVPSQVQASRFDGTDDRLRINSLTGSANGTGLSGNLNIDFQGGDGVLQTILWAGTGSDYDWKLEKTAANLFQLDWRNAAGTAIGSCITTTAVTAASGWTNLQFDINGTSAVMRVNFTNESNNTPGAADNIVLTGAVTIGASDDSAARNYINACLANLWLVDESLGLATDDIAEQFYDSTLGKPRNLGAGGAGPSANVLVYLKSNFANFYINLAGGGDFTLTGALTSCTGPGNYSPQHVPTPVSFPVVESRSAQSIEAASTFTFPAGSVEGDLIVIVFAIIGADPTHPTGWTIIVNNVSSTGRGIVYAKVLSAADETAGSVDIVDANRKAATLYRISNHNGVAGVEGAIVQQPATVTPNPPNLIPSWGSKSTLWIAGTAIEEGLRTLDLYPTGYTDGQFATGNSTSGTRVSVASAERELEAASEDPGTFTWSASAFDSDGVAMTIAVEPAP